MTVGVLKVIDLNRETSDDSDAAVDWERCTGWLLSVVARWCGERRVLEYVAVCFCWYGGELRRCRLVPGQWGKALCPLAQCVERARESQAHGPELREAGRTKAGPHIGALCPGLRPEVLQQEPIHPFIFSCAFLAGLRDLYRVDVSPSDIFLIALLISPNSS